MTSEQLDRWASEIRRRDHGTTHWDGCEESHPRCRELALIARVRELEAERDWLAAEVAQLTADLESYDEEMQRRIARLTREFNMSYTRLDAEIERLRVALAKVPTPAREEGQ